MDAFYDPSLSYERNDADGPFGAFAQPMPRRRTSLPMERFAGLRVHEPFGIAAGPLVNANFVAAAFAHGFDLCVYKTVRTRAQASLPFPNVLAVHVDGDLTPGCAQPVLADDRFTRPLSISNSFGVPSQDPDVWQPDMSLAVAAAGAGQVLIGGFQGTRVRVGDRAYIADHASAARLVVETGARVLELNMSCPNEGSSRLLCFDTALVIRVLTAVREEIGDVPLFIKLAYFAEDRALRDLVSATSHLVDGYSAINTIPARLVDEAGDPALPGQGREVSGVCGRAIRWAGLDMTRRLASLRDSLDAEYTIVGVGGVSSPADYLAYRAAGADAVMSATGAMWNARLGADVRASSGRG